MPYIEGCNNPERHSRLCDRRRCHKIEGGMTKWVHILKGADGFETAIFKQFGQPNIVIALKDLTPEARRRYKVLT
jgi:hypothetical protein